MYVCLCNNLKCRDFKAASDAGAQTVQDAFKAYGVRPRCGSCLETAEKFVIGAKATSCCSDESDLPIAAE